MWDEDCELRPGELWWNSRLDKHRPVNRDITANDIVAIAKEYMAYHGCSAEEAIHDMDWPVDEELKRWLQKASSG